MKQGGPDVKTLKILDVNVAITVSEFSRMLTMSVPRASKPRTQPGLEGEEVSFQNLHSVFSEVSAKLPPHAMRGLIISPSGRKC